MKPIHNRFPCCGRASYLRTGQLTPGDTVIKQCSCGVTWKITARESRFIAGAFVLDYEKA